MRFRIEESKTPGWWVVTDTHNGIVVRFKDKDYNGTQEVTILDDAHGEMGDVAARTATVAA